MCFGILNSANIYSKQKILERKKHIHFYNLQEIPLPVLIFNIFIVRFNVSLHEIVY